MAETTPDLTTTPTQLTSHVRGKVRTPESDGYDQGRTGFQLLDPHRPEVVIEVDGTRDVCTGIEYAAGRGMEIAVQATGHGRGAGLRGGVLIDTRRMCGVRVDPWAKTAWVEAGATWQQVIECAAPHGLAPLSGSFPGVGAVSYTLGGGIGLLARRYGFAADHVHRLDVVTVDARHRRVSATDEPELFWAMRGAGSNFGVVTGMEIDLMPVERIYGGGLFFDVAEAPGVLSAWREWTATVPDEMTSAVSMLAFPDLSMMPEPLRGRHVAQLQISYAGTAERGEQLVAPLRTIGPLLRDTLRELPYSQSSAVFDEPDQPHGYRSANVLLDDLDPAALATLTRQSSPSAPIMCVVGIRHLGGALARPPRSPNVIGHRDAGYSLGVLSPVEVGDEPRAHALNREVLAPFARDTLGPALNFSFGPLERAQVRAAFDPADHQRLARLKAEHDPRGLLHANHHLGAKTATMDPSDTA